MPFTTALEAENFIFSSYLRVESQLTGPDALTRLPALTRRLLDRLGRPDSRFTPILVTGSKGKGSISLLTAKLLEALGYRVGLITSPHIVNFRERIRLNGKAISEADFVRWAEVLEIPAREIMAGLTGRQYLSPTGLILSLACLYWADQKVDFAVVEAGRGGRYDDCVVLDNPIALFGPMLLEHQRQLGDTVEEIAASKVVLLKSGGVGLTVPQTEPVQALMYGWAGQIGGQLFSVGSDIGVHRARIEQVYLQVDIAGRVNTFSDLKLSIPALYEAENLAVALGAVEVATDDRVLSPEKLERIYSTLETLRWPGRMHRIVDHPLTVLDCAVTGSSTAAVLASLGERLQAPIAVLLGVPDDRDWRGVLDTLNGKVDYLVCAGVSTPRLNFSPTVADYAQAHFPATTQILRAIDFASAYNLLAKLQPAPATLLVLGTQTFIAQALRFYGTNLEQL